MGLVKYPKRKDKSVYIQMFPRISWNSRMGPHHQDKMRLWFPRAKAWPVSLLARVSLAVKKSDKTGIHTFVDVSLMPYSIVFVVVYGDLVPGAAEGLVGT